MRSSSREERAPVSRERSPIRRRSGTEPPTHSSPQITEETGIRIGVARAGQWPPESLSRIRPTRAVRGRATVPAPEMGIPPEQPGEGDREERPDPRRRRIVRRRWGRVPRPPAHLPRCFVCKVVDQAADEDREGATVEPGDGVRCALCRHFFHRGCYVAHLQLECSERACFCRRALEGFPPWDPRDGGDRLNSSLQARQ